MLSMIPAALMVTMLYLFTLSPSLVADENQQFEALGNDALFHHERALDRVRSEGLTAGSVTPYAVPVFQELMPWESEIISSPLMRVLVTYVPEVSGVLPDKVSEAFASIGVSEIEYIPDTYVGTYTYHTTGTGGLLGGRDFAGVNLPMLDGSPAIVTVFEYLP